jgi:hypothetical protein
MRNLKKEIEMKLGFALSLGFLLTASASFASRVEEYKVFSNSADLAKEHRNIKAVDARYFEVATKIEISEDPYCNHSGEIDCTETRVLERVPAVQVTVEYTDGIFPDHEADNKAYMSFNLPTDLFPADHIEELKRASGFFGGHSVRREFLRNHINFSVSQVKKTIEIVDVRNSKICHINESGYPRPGCKEVLRYKPATVMVQRVNISAK